mgnify:CR=1 FL=1
MFSLSNDHAYMMTNMLSASATRTVQIGGSVPTHFEKITHFEIFFSKCVKFVTKSTHFEKKFQVRKIS